MGTFRVTIQAVGGHGCDRDRKDNETVKGCGMPNCPDCMARELVNKWKAQGMFGYSDTYATLQHWPGSASEVVDNLITGKRKGNF